MPTDSRGQVKITLGGKEYLLRPDFATNQAMEDTLGLTYFQLAEKIVKRTLTLRQTAIIIHGGMVGGGAKDITVEQVGQMLVEDGMYSCFTALADYITGITTGGRDGEEKKDSQPATPARTTGKIRLQKNN